MRTRHVGRQQSAMEYLMTYGWSMLIIAIVLAALFSLGVFSNSNLGPHAQTNSCRVYRPNGPGTTTNINLEGVCNGELPQYVSLFNGVSSNVVAPYSSTVNFVNAFSVVAWINPYVNNTYNEFVIGSDNAGTRNWKLGLTPSGQIRFDLYPPPYNPAVEFESNGGNLNTNTWYQVAATFNGVSVATYLDGVYLGSTSFPTNTVSNTANPISIGQDQAISSRIFNGLIANVQLYNSGLDASSILALYQEGVGGAPIAPQNLAAWWPLDGDTNDYSGNNQNGVPSAITFTSSWSAGYTTP